MGNEANCKCCGKRQNVYNLIGRRSKAGGTYYVCRKCLDFSVYENKVYEYSYNEVEKGKVAFVIDFQFSEKSNFKMYDVLRDVYGWNIVKNGDKIDLKSSLYLSKSSMPKSWKSMDEMVHIEKWNGEKDYHTFCNVYVGKIDQEYYRIVDRAYNQIFRPMYKMFLENTQEVIDIFGAVPPANLGSEYELRKYFIDVKDSLVIFKFCKYVSSYQYIEAVKIMEDIIYKIYTWYVKEYVMNDFDRRRYSNLDEHLQNKLIVLVRSVETKLKKTVAEEVQFESYNQISNACFMGEKVSPFVNEKQRDQNINKSNGTTVMSNTSSETRNIIIHGTYGSGKTYSAIKYAVSMCEEIPLYQVEKMSEAEVFAKYRELISQEKRILVTSFHQSYGYEEFIEGIRPRMNQHINQCNNELSYEVQDGILKEYCLSAKKSNKPYVLIIDEMNRGDITSIFGDTLSLIEPEKRENACEEMKVILPYSKEIFGIPRNLNIIGTMSFVGISTTKIDPSLYRRFQFIEKKPEPIVLEKLGIRMIGNIDLVEMLSAINNRMECLYGKEYVIGHAYFMPLQKEKSIRKLREIFLRSIMPLLQKWCDEDYEKMQLIFADNMKEEKYKFIIDRPLCIKSIFKGELQAYLPEKQYEIQPDAFFYEESYIQIYE